jgi:hypothetical protein
MKRMKSIEDISKKIRFTAEFEAVYHPIDRGVLAPILDQILEQDIVRFVSYNLNHYSELYFRFLMACLPEVWCAMDRECLSRLIISTDSKDGLISIVKFLYKYLEISILGMISVSNPMASELKDAVFGELYENPIGLFKDSFDIEELEKSHFGINLSDLLKAKYSLLQKVPEVREAALNHPDFLKEILLIYSPSR